jgi:hypothetical protein
LPLGIQWYTVGRVVSTRQELMSVPVKNAHLA